jgi:hypothetical protein
MLKMRDIAIFLAIMLVFYTGVGDTRPVAYPYWQTVNYCNSTTAYGRVTIDGAEASEEDLVGAFIGGECRGVQYVTISEGESYVTLVINGELPELADFAIFDADANLVCPIELSILTCPGGSIGYPPEFLELAAVSSSGNHLPVINLPEIIELNEPEIITWEFGENFYDSDGDLLLVEMEYPQGAEVEMVLPDWQPVSYSGTTQVFAEVMIEGEAAAPGDMVGAFIGGECRGEGVVSDWNGTAFLSISVFGTSVEQVDFRIFDVSQGLNWKSEAVIFTEPGGMIGYPDLVEINGQQLILESDLSLTINQIPEISTYFTLTLSDEPPHSVNRAQVYLQSGNANTAPQINLPQLVFEEDQQFQMDLLEYVQDPDGDELGFQVFNNSELPSQLCDTILHLLPEENWYGSAQMQILVTDGHRLYSMDTLYAEVLPVNDPPAVVLPSELEIQEDEFSVLDMSNRILDIDGDSLQISFNEPEHLAIEITQPSWQAVNYNQWSYAYLTVSYSEGLISDHSQIAAFAAGECRGNGIINNYQGISYAFFQIYCETATGIIFKVYDQQQNRIYYNSQPVMVYPGSNLGFPPDYYQLVLDRQQESQVFAVLPAADWYGIELLEVEVSDPAGASASGDITVVVLPVADPPRLEFPSEVNFAAGRDDWLELGEFVYEPDGDEYWLEIVDSAGLELSLDDEILYINSCPQESGVYSVEIHVEDETGLWTSDVLSVEVLEFYEIEKQLSSGWNWLGLGLGTNHPEPEYFLSSLTGAVEYLKGLTGFLYYYPVEGWTGSLTELSSLSLYKTQLIEADDLHLAGWVLSPAETAISINQGWNWISYLPQEAIAINEALAPLNGNADYIKYLNAYAIYYPEYGWIGPLQQMEPGCGYVIYASSDQIFHYPESGRNAAVKKTNSKIINPHQYQYTASLTAVIKGYKPGMGDEILAYAGEQLAGIASSEIDSVIDLRAEFGEFYWFIYLYTNLENPADLCLLLRRQNGEVRKIAGSYSWQPDSRLGNLETPVVLKFADEHSISEKKAEKINFYPNPFLTGENRKELKISINSSRTAAPEAVALYNIKGQKITGLDLINSGDEYIVENPSGWSYPSGVYLIRAVFANGAIINRKLLIQSR